jgi:uncharacterized protein
MLIENNYKKIITFLILLILFSIPFYLLIAGEDNRDIQILYTLIIMLVPGIAALITQVVFQKNIKGFGWRWRKTEYHLVSLLVPILYGLIIFLPICVFNLGEFSIFELGRFLGEEFNIPLVTSGVHLITLSFLYVVMIGFIGGIFAFGEELGWRGLLVPELFKTTGFIKTSIISGIIWAAWHFPLFLFGDYIDHSPCWHELIFAVIGMMGIGFLMNWIRLKSGSIWTAVIFHTSHNIFIQEIYPALTRETQLSETITGEFGIGIALIGLILIAIFIIKKPVIS